MRRNEDALEGNE
jgi:hypothetical protein